MRKKWIIDNAFVLKLFVIRYPLPIDLICES